MLSEELRKDASPEQHKFHDEIEAYLESQGIPIEDLRVYMQYIKGKEDTQAIVSLIDEKKLAYDRKLPSWVGKGKGRPVLDPYPELLSVQVWKSEWDVGGEVKEKIKKFMSNYFKDFLVKRKRSMEEIGIYESRGEKGMNEAKEQLHIKDIETAENEVMNMQDLFDVAFKNGRNFPTSVTSLEEFKSWLKQEFNRSNEGYIKMYLKNYYGYDTFKIYKISIGNFIAIPIEFDYSFLMEAIEISKEEIEKIISKGTYDGISGLVLSIENDPCIADANFFQSVPSLFTI